MSKAKIAETELNLPQAPDAERAVLGTVFINPDLAFDLVAGLQPADFFITSHRKIFYAICDLVNQHKGVDHISLAEQLRQNQELEAVGGKAYLASLMDGTIRCSNIKQYIESIKTAATRRKLLRASSRITSAALDEFEDFQDVVLKARNEIAEATKAEEQAESKPLIQVMRERLVRVEELGNRPSELSGLPSGLVDLDRITCGFQNSDLVILAARPSVGKTSLALGIIEHVASMGKSPFLFSIEMTKESVSDRMLTSMARVDSHRYRGGFLERDEWTRLTGALQQYVDFKKPIGVDDRSTIDTMEMRAVLKDFRAKQGLDLIVVDYLGLVKPRTPNRNRQEEVSEIAKDCKAIAKEFGVPLIALTQLNRQIENRTDPIPKLSDLRESGDIEAAADLIMFLDREVLNEKGEQNDDMTARIYIGKHRNGPTGKVDLAFLNFCTRFENAYRG